MPFSKYISEGPLFSKPITASENFKYCVDKITGNVSLNYSKDFTGIEKIINDFYNLIKNSIITVKLLLRSILEFFYELINIILRRFNLLNTIIKDTLTRAFNSLNILGLVFSIFWKLMEHLISLIKFVIVYLINLLYL